jgi:hypothetical protein
MVVNDFNIVCVAVMPRKANTPLGVNPDVVLAGSIAD